jgi:two-component sensor histidine kinase/CheY-like chemotaxis protein
MADKIRILMVEDNPSDIRIIKEMLYDVKDFEFDFKHVKRLGDGLKLLNNDSFDVLLLDLYLPDSHGIDTFFMAQKSTPDIPIVIFSGAADEKIAIEAVHEGAQDYLMKGEVEGRLLARSIFYAIERKHTEEELKKHRDHLEELVEKRTLGLKEANKQLLREINERKQAEEEIRASLEEKKILLDEIQERIQNSLGIIIKIIDGEYTQNDYKDLQDFNREIQNRAKAVELINEMLIQSEDFAMIDFAHYIRNLTEYLYEFYNVDPQLIQLEMDIEGIPLDIDVAIPCALIINELVINSIKHAFNGNNGKITIKLHQNTKNTILQVADNGKGLPKDFKLENAETSGFRLINKLVTQLNGKIELNRDNGTEFKVIF